MFITIEQQAGSSYPRSEPRMNVMLDGHVRSRRGTFPCRVHDLSRGGACVEAQVPHARGETVTVVRGGLEVKGTVAWSEGRRFGIYFDERIRATELLIQMSASRQCIAAQPVPVSAAAIPLSPSR